MTALHIKAAGFAAAAAFAGLLATAPFSQAEPNDFFNYLDCLKSGTPQDICCLRNGGLINPQTDECVPPRPRPILNNPGQTTKPPTLPPVVGTNESPVLAP